MPVQVFNDRSWWVGIFNYTSAHTKWYVPGEPHLSAQQPRS